jgi:predicted nucleotidyltransferase component of viral defense system
MGYFLTGGTALSEFYFQHRTSEDLDLFSLESRDLSEDAAFFQDCLSSAGIQAKADRAAKDTLRFVAFQEGGEEIKIDMVNDRHHISPTLDFRGIAVDSLEDIAVNKVCCCISRNEPKDCVDLYFILTESEWSLDYLMEQAKRKDAAFDNPDGPLLVADYLARAASLRLPDFMLKPLSVTELQDRLVAEANRIRERMRPRGRG